MNNRVHIVAAVVSVVAGVCPAAVTVGLDNVGAYAFLFAGKRIGIVCNHTAVNRTGQHAVEVIRSLPDLRVTALFGPEHGIYGLADAGRKIDDGVDERYGIPVYSLYGKTSKPTPEMLQNVDVLIFDIQDIGARFYTYIWTMALAMEAAGENDKLFVVLDRPNPIGGVAVEGPLLEREQTSFVGLYAIPVRHGMTAGELARMFIGEEWLKDGVGARLLVVPADGWHRSQWFDQTGLQFIKPSPNMPDLATAAVYPGLCLLEGTNVSEGRGTAKPFLQFGAPWINAAGLVERLNGLEHPGVRFCPATFRPTSSKHANVLCHGAAVEVVNRTAMEPFRLGVEVIKTLHDMYPQQFEWRESHFDRLCGVSGIREAISQGAPVAELAAAWRKDVEAFEKQRRPYLLYD